MHTSSTLPARSLFSPFLPAQSEVPEEVMIEEALGGHEWTEGPLLTEEGLWTAEWRGGDPAIDAPYVLPVPAMDERGETS